jgi:hypothetical protein
MPNIDQATRDITSPVWDMSQERVLVETILNERLNFFLVFFSVVLAGSVNARSDQQLTLVLCLGSLLAMLLAFALVRAYLKLQTILTMLRADATHPFTIVDGRHSSRFAARAVTGIAIPALLTSLLTTGAVAASLGRFPGQPITSPDVLSSQTASVANNLNSFRERQAQETRRIDEELAALRASVVELRNRQGTAKEPRP